MNNKYVSIYIERPTNRRVEPEESPLAELMDIAIWDNDLYKLTAEEICEELFHATNAPAEEECSSMFPDLQWKLRCHYGRALEDCENEYIKFFSMSVGDVVTIAHEDGTIFGSSFKQLRCDPYGWSDTGETRIFRNQ